MKKIILMCLFILTGCATYTSQFQSNMSASVQIESDNYEIVGDIEGIAETTLIIPLYPIPIVLGDNLRYGAVHGNGWFSYGKGLTYNMAMYNAIENAEGKYPGGVDALITPKYTSKVSGFPPFYTKTEVHIKGKGIRLITKEKAEIE